MTVSSTTAWRLAACFSVLAAVGCASQRDAASVQARLHEFVAAFRSHDPDRIARVVLICAKPGDSPRFDVSTLARPELAEFVVRRLANAEVWQVDDYLRGPGIYEDEAPPGALRVLCLQHLPGAGSVPECDDVIALYLVEQDGTQRFVWHAGLFPWDTWGYHWDDPGKTYESLMHALERRDFRTIYDRIDPAWRPPDTPLADWLRTVREHQVAVDRWRADCEAARAAAKGQRAPMPTDPPAPFVQIGQCGHQSYVAYLDDARERARVSHLRTPATADTEEPYEVFVKRDRRWYWQPWAEYTFWPLAPGAGAVRPPEPEPVAGPDPEELTPDLARRKVREVLSGYKLRDPQRLAGVFAFPEVSADDRVVQYEGAGALLPLANMALIQLRQMEIWEIDHDLRAPAHQNVTWPQGAVRVLCREHGYRDDPARATASRMAAFAFVRHADRWRVFCWPASPGWRDWYYIFRSPKEAYEAVALATEVGDYRSVREMIDPALLPPEIGVEQWLQLVREHAVANAHWAAAQEAAPPATGAADRTPPPYAGQTLPDIGQFGRNGDVSYLDPRRTLARVSPRVDPAVATATEPPFVTFVQRRERWYWQPKAEYTLWPLAPNSAGSQPVTAPTSAVRR